MYSASACVNDGTPAYIMFLLRNFLFSPLSRTDSAAACVNYVFTAQILIVSFVKGFYAVLRYSGTLGLTLPAHTLYFIPPPPEDIPIFQRISCGYNWLRNQSFSFFSSLRRHLRISRIFYGIPRYPQAAADWCEGYEKDDKDYFCCQFYTQEFRNTRRRRRSLFTRR